MGEINLTKGFKVLVDDADMERVSPWKWRLLSSVKNPRNIYAQRTFRENGKAKCVLMHRFLLGVTDRQVEVDHINGNGLDNRRTNLRLCTRIQNQANARKRKDSKKAMKGVSYDKRGLVKPWIARICFHGKRYVGGYFHTEKEAHEVYLSMAKKFYGEFANAG